ncbi:MAG: primosomal protein N' [Deltaproteobacteria bacterium]|nr:primosomal protein N' [Deltaproteobacteria bacterium]
MEGKLVQVAVGRPVRGLFTYRVPETIPAVREGQRVLVPFGAGKALGFIMGEAREAPPGRLRDLSQVLDAEPMFSPDLLSFLQWTAAYYRYPLGEVLRSALPPGLTRPGEAPQSKPGVCELVCLTELARTEPRPRGVAMNAVLDYLATAPGEVDLEELATAIPGVRDPLKRLVGKGLCSLREVPLVPDRPELAFAGKAVPVPTSEQSAALVEIEKAVAARSFAPILLRGVTGSGKTEVYLRSISRAIELGLGALVLVPEIALTPQLVGRFRARFGEKVAVLHSGLRDSERLAEWRRLRQGEAPLAVGVRSAIFAPIARLGIIVVDEEHDGSFKQEEKLRYHARDLAVVRAQRIGCPVILGSATPSLESLANARGGRYQLLELTRRVDDRPMPAVHVVDMRVEGRGHVSAAFPQLAARSKMRALEARKAAEASAPYGEDPAARPPAREEIEEELSRGPPLLSEELRASLEDVLAKGRQAILFLNRRGQSTYHVCLACGRSVTCRDCAVSLTLHGTSNRLLCHYCGHTEPLPAACPQCGGPIDSLGMGTEAVEAELGKRFPAARVCRLDRDSATQAEEITALLAAFAKGEKDILVGTQMVAKGHDFPGVTLVGVLLADIALNLPDFRAAERTFQLLAQVAGRAGRGVEPGRVVVQTFNPEAPAIAHVVGHDYLAFSEHELALRRAYFYPPFCRLLAVRIEGVHPQGTAEAARLVAKAVGQAARDSGGALRLIGPAKAPFAKLRGKVRWQLLIKGPTARSLVPAAEAVEKVAEQLPGNARASVDVDPIGLM